VLGTSSRPSVPASPVALPLEMSQAPACPRRATSTASTSVDAAAVPLWPDVAVSAVAAWWTTAARVSEYWTGALARGAAPLDVAADAARLWDIALRREPPTWATANEVVLSTPLALLRSFCEPSGSTLVPTLIVAPQSGHASSIVDYSPDQSQVNAIRSAGLGRVYALDWRGATQPTKDAGIDDYVAELDAALDALGGRANLIGDSQGGWLAAIYAALRPARVNTLTVAGAPIDFHAGRPPIQRMVDLLGMRFFERLVALGGGVMRGEDVHRGFMLIEPENELGKQFELLARLDDDEHVARYRAFENWHKHTQDLAGPFYLWTVEHLFRDNELIRGELRVGGERVDLRRISMPVNLLAGAKDRITPSGQVFALADAVATEPGEVILRRTGGGHLGLFMGREALREHWPPILAGVLERSRS
jgi:poly(3-hydroxybutyrate) depolymerase